MTMMEYESMMESVLRKAQRLKVDGRDVVLVMSKAIHRAICESEYAELFRILNTNPCTYGTCYGMSIGIINDPRDRTIADAYRNMISPVLVGMAHNPVINQLGDIIVCLEEDGSHLYQMTNEHPAQFHDIGLTVNFSTEAGDTAAVYIERIAAAAATLPNNAKSAYMSTKNPVRGKRKDAVSESELNPGDTKLLDDFLDGFKRNSVMQTGG